METGPFCGTTQTYSATTEGPRKEVETLGLASDAKRLKCEVSLPLLTPLWLNLDVERPSIDVETSVNEARNLTDYPSVY